MLSLIFSLFLVIWLVYVFVIFYHFIRFGIGVQPKILSFIFLIGSFLFFILMVFSFFQVNWQEVLKNVSDFLQIQ